MNISSQKETEKELLQMQLHKQQDELINLERQYQKISILRHDYYNKINCVNILLSDNKYCDAKKYVKEIFVKNVSIQFKSLIIFKCIFLAMIMYLTLVFATIISETLNISQTDTAFWYTMGL